MNNLDRAKYEVKKAEQTLDQCAEGTSEWQTAREQLFDARIKVRRAEPKNYGTDEVGRSLRAVDEMKQNGDWAMGY